MGTSYAYKPDTLTVKQYIDREYNHERCRVVKSVLRGNVYYAALEVGANGLGDVVIGCVTLVSHSDGMIGLKDMDEGMGPNQAECPRSILKLLSPTTNEWALKWREKCEAYHAHRALSKSIKAGDRLRFTHPLHFDGWGKCQEFVYAPRVLWGTKKKRDVFIAQDFSYPLDVRITKWRDRSFTVIQ